MHFSSASRAFVPRSCASEIGRLHVPPQDRQWSDASGASNTETHPEPASEQRERGRASWHPSRCCCCCCFGAPAARPSAACRMSRLGDADRPPLSRAPFEGCALPLPPSVAGGRCLDNDASSSPLPLRDHHTAPLSPLPLPSPLSIPLQYGTVPRQPASSYRRPSTPHSLSARTSSSSRLVSARLASSVCSFDIVLGRSRLQTTPPIVTMKAFATLLLATLVSGSLASSHASTSPHRRHHNKGPLDAEQAIAKRATYSGMATWYDVGTGNAGYVSTNSLHLARLHRHSTLTSAFTSFHHLFPHPPALAASSSTPTSTSLPSTSPCTVTLASDPRGAARPSSSPTVKRPPPPP